MISRTTLSASALPSTLPVAPTQWIQQPRVGSPMRTSTILRSTTALRKAPCAACGSGCVTATLISVAAAAAATISGSLLITRSLFSERVAMPCIDVVAMTAAYNWDPSVALMPVTATAGDVAAGARRGGVGPGSVARTGQRQFHAPVLRPTLRRVVRGHGVGLAEPLRGHQAGVDALRDQELHHG